MEVCIDCKLVNTSPIFFGGGRGGEGGCGPPAPRSLLNVKLTLWKLI